MSINKLELFENTKALWPAVINLDGMIINGERVVGLQILNELYQRIEASIDVDDHWKQLAIWAFHQALPAGEESELECGCKVVHPRAVKFEVFDQKMRDNLLGDDCWIAEREIYFEGVGNDGRAEKGSESL